MSGRKLEGGMEHPLSAWCLRAQRALVAVAVAGTALIVWPSPTEPFGLPKATFAVMAAVVIAALAAVRIAVNRRAEVPLGVVPIAMVVLVVCMAGATVASATPAVSLVGPTRYTGLVPYIAYLVIALGTISGFRAIRPVLVLQAILLAGAVQVLYGLIQSFGWQPLPFGSTATPVFGTLGNANFFAGWLGITAPVAVWATLERSHRRNWRIAAAAVTAGCLLALWRSNSFQGLPAAGAGLLLVLAVWAINGGAQLPASWVARMRAVPRGAVFGGAALGALAALGLAIAALPLVSQRIGSGGAARLEFWDAARRLVLDHPVLGTGPGTFVQHYAAYYEPTGTVAYELTDDPHSVPLTMFTSGGFVVGLAYLALVALTTVVLVRGLRRTTGRDRLLLAGLGGAWLAYQVQSVVSIDIPPLALAHWVLAASMAAVAGSLRFASVGSEPVSGPPVRRKPRASRPRPMPVGTKAGIGAAVFVAALLLVVMTRPMRGVAATEQVDDLISAGQPQAALDRAREAVELAPWDARAWAEYSRVAKGLREFDTARRAARRAVYLAPASSAYALQLAGLAQRDQDIEAAIRWNLHAAEVDPLNPEVLARVGRNLLTYGRGAEAESLARKGLRMQERAVLWAVLGLRYALDGEEARAIEAYRRAVEIDPHNEEARSFLEARDIPGPY